MDSSLNSSHEVEELLYALVVDYAAQSDGWYDDLEYDLWRKVHTDDEYADEYIRTLLRDMALLVEQYGIWFLSREDQFKFVPARIFERMYDEWLMDKSIP